MEGPPADYPAAFRAAALKLGFQVKVDSYAHIEPADFSRAKLAHILSLLKPRADDDIILFCPGALEHFVEGADMSFQFSAYRNWFDPATTTVIPHPWTPTWHLARQESLRWKSKPSCTIGFMGAAYRRSRGASLAGAIPPLRRWIRGGGLVRNAYLAAWLDERRLRARYVPTFIRREVLEAVESAPDDSGLAEIQIIDTEGGNFAPWHRDEFAQHMAETTYVLCPRGCENYSYRAYEALRFGRVPVIIDSDMVLPSSIDWQDVGIIVPDGCSDSIRARIVDDYRSRDAAAFLKRQEAAFRASDYLDGDDWLADCVLEAVRKLGVAPPEQ
jgi:hypothetical protein